MLEIGPISVHQGRVGEKPGLVGGKWYVPVRSSECIMEHQEGVQSGGAMATKKIVSRNRVEGRAVGRAKKKSVAKRGNSGLNRRLEDLREQVDIMLPEMTARIAALEHLLLGKQLCSRKDLIDARQFVRMQEA